MNQILDGIRVLEWGTAHAGPAAAAMLTYLGADVIKIEARSSGGGDRPEGDTARAFPGSELPGGRNTLHEGANHSKRSLSLDLSKPEGKAIAYRLVEKSDVFVTNFRRSAVARQGMDYDTLKGYNPRLIYLGVSAFGWEGPEGDLGGYDFQGQARSGVMMAMGEPDMPPLLIQYGVIDHLAATMGSYGVIAALLARERYGVGQEVHSSLLGGAMNLLYCNILQANLTGSSLAKHDRKATNNPLRNMYRCQDGTWLTCTHQPSQRSWPQFCKALGIERLIEDPLYVDDLARAKNSRELIAILDGIFATKTREEWLKIAAEAKLNFAPINEAGDLIDDPQAIANKYLVDSDFPGIGPVKVPGFPIQFSETPARTRGIAPLPGQDTDEVLMEVVGLSAAEVEDLKARQIA
jgi:crotonobetainyl-CoA:carnitine CoA-transferase CaiB-like acyl-CoA transferase